MADEFCAGDGGGLSIRSSRDPKALLKICGNNSDLIRYWYDGTNLIFDPIRDGNFLSVNDVKFPLAPATPGLPRPPVAVRYGMNRDNFRIYTPPRNNQSAMMTLFRSRMGIDVPFQWLAIDKLDVNGVGFIYDAGQNAFTREDGSITSIDPIGV
jgi:hypothetical protein